MFDDFEINWVALGLAVVIGGMFAAMPWVVPTWQTYPFWNKVFISVAIIPVSYFLVCWQINR